MFCIKCGSQLPEGAAFCNVCGSKVVGPGSQNDQPPMPGSVQGPDGIQPPVVIAKKNKLPVIMGISIASVALLVLLVIVIFNPFGKKIKVGDTITFGNYPQEADGTVKPIEWTVLEIRDGKALIISNYGLDCQKYHTEREDATWETCSLRSWLNRYFLNTAFSAEEQQKILVTDVVNEDNPTYGTPGGNPTRDKVFLLSIEETVEIFNLTKLDGGILGREYAKGDAAGCKATPYAVEQGVVLKTWTEKMKEEDEKYIGNCAWWLRSVGHDTWDAAFVTTDTVVFAQGFGARMDVYAVRPAMWIDIK